MRELPVLTLARCTPPVEQQHQYQYTADLICLDSQAAKREYCLPGSRTCNFPPKCLSLGLSASAWAAALANHPDRYFAEYILRGIRKGFRIGFKRGSPLHSAQANMQSATLHPEIISHYIENERQLGRMLSPFARQDLPPDLHISRFGVIPKGHTPGKWRLITDLSFPKGRSVNDGINPIFCSLSYTSVDVAAAIAASVGKRALLAKVDIESAYRLIPVHPQDRHLQAVCWEGKIYVDQMLPFGLRSAPKVFNAVADALQWYLREVGIPRIEHNLDDFIIISPPPPILRTVNST